MRKIKQIMDKLDREDKLVLKGFFVVTTLTIIGVLLFC